MIKNYLCYVFLLFAFWGCEKDPNLSNDGDVYVKVFSKYYGSNKPLAGAKVFTIPASQEILTDENGIAILRELDQEKYEVYVIARGHSTGMMKVDINKSSTVSIQFILDQVDTTDLEPKIQILSPTNSVSTTINENIEFLFNVTDNKTPSNDIKLEITSNLDGKINEGYPDTYGNFRFITNRLSYGYHTITIKATNNDGYSSTKTISVGTVFPPKVIMESVSLDGNEVLIKWAKYTNADFRTYQVIRSTSKDQYGEVIATIESINTTTFTDKNPPLAKEVFYSIKVINTQNFDRISDPLSVIEPLGKVFQHKISNAVIHPTNTILYITDEISHRLIAFDYKTLKEINSVTIDDKIGKIAIGNNGFGLEIYVPNSNGFIKIYNASTLQLTTTINTTIATTAVATNGNGYIIASVSPSTWWDKPIRTYDRKTREFIDGKGKQPGNTFCNIPNSDKWISITNVFSPPDMLYSEYNEKGEFILQKEDSYHGDHHLNSNIFKISPNGQYTITGAPGAVYSANSAMLYKRMIDRNSLEFSDFDFSNDGNTIYGGTSNKQSIQVIKYPDLTIEREITCKGYPAYLFRVNNEIITISKTNRNASDDGYYVFETIKL